MIHYLKQYKTRLKVEKGKSINTLLSYFRDLNQYHTYLNNELKIKSITKVTFGHTRSYIRYLNDKGMSANSIRRAISSLRNYHNYLVDEKLMKDNPAQLLEFPKVPKKLPQANAIESFRECGRNCICHIIFSIRSRILHHRCYYYCRWWLDCQIAVTNWYQFSIHDLCLTNQDLI